MIIAEKTATNSSLTDEEVVTRVLTGDVASFEILMRRHNQRLYRIARAVLHNSSDAEDVIQDAYVRAYEHLDQFAGRAKFSTWLSRIAVNEALARNRYSTRFEEVSPMADETGERGERMDRFASSGPDPEQQASRSELQGLFESAIGSLPDSYREVLVLRDVEEMDTADTAHALDISEENVKTRLHRARALLTKKLQATVSSQSKEVFPFHAVRCDRVVKNVFERILRNREAVPDHPAVQ
jgi:RNA polymerase sigma-70 factor, ECF subfamily